MKPRFLSLDETLAVHDDQIKRYGGSSGVRDLGLLESALGAPKSTFDGAWLHDSIEEMASAYLFHVARNHPFIDGNKRSALACALVFMWINDVTVTAPPNELYELVLHAAEGKTTKSEIAVFLKRHRDGKRK